MNTAAIRPPPEDELYADDYPTRYFAKLDLIVHALPTKESKLEYVLDQFATMYRRFGRWQCRHRAEIPNDDPNRLGLADFVFLLRGLNHRKRAIEAGK